MTSKFKCKKIEYSPKDRATANPQVLSSFAVSLNVLTMAVLSIPPPKKKRTMSDLCEYAISAYFRIFLLHILLFFGPHILKKMSAFF